MAWSALEQAILLAYHKAWAHRAFPAPADVRLRRRHKTDLGWYLLLESEGRAHLPDWDCLLPGDEFLMVETRTPACQARISLIMMNGRPMTLELCRLSGAPWPGEEAGWTLTARVLV